MKLVTVINEIRDARGLGAIDKAVAWTLVSRARAGGVPKGFVEPASAPPGLSCYASLDLIAEDAGCSRRAAWAAIQRFERHGMGALHLVIMKHPRARGGRPQNVYRLTMQSAPGATCKVHQVPHAKCTRCRLQTRKAADQSAPGATCKVHHVHDQSAPGATTKVHQLHAKDLSKNDPSEGGRAGAREAAAAEHHDPRAVALAEELRKYPRLITGLTDLERYTSDVHLEALDRSGLSVEGYAEDVFREANKETPDGELPTHTLRRLRTFARRAGAHRRRGRRRDVQDAHMTPEEVEALVVPPVPKGAAS